MLTPASFPLALSGSFHVNWNKGKRRGRKTRGFFCLIHFREQLHVSVCCREKYHLCIAVSGRNINCKKSFIFRKTQTFRHELYSFIARHSSRRGTVRSEKEDKNETDEFPLQFPGGSALLKRQSNSTGFCINRWQTAFLVFASHLVNHRSHLVWPLFFLNRWKYTFIINCSEEIWEE